MPTHQNARTPNGLTKQQERHCPAHYRNTTDTTTSDIMRHPWRKLGAVVIVAWVASVVPVAPAEASPSLPSNANAPLATANARTTSTALAAVPTPIAPTDTNERSAKSTVDPIVDPLLRSVIERLALSEAVARAKFDTGKPVQDTPREQALLNSVAKLAPQYGVTDAQARAFFSNQIEAGKRLQTALLARWQRAGGAPGQATSLDTTLRPRLDALSHTLLEHLGDVCALPADPARAARIHHARERLAQVYRLSAWQQAALDQATSSLCLTSTR